MTATRFDSLAGGRSYLFEEPFGEVVAWHLDEVVPALRALEATVAGGAHAAGFISYEAAPSFDPALATHDAGRELPLLWFGLYARRTEQAPLAGIPNVPDPPRVGRWDPSVSPDEHRRRVAEIRELIAAGDTYQVNLTFRLAADYHGTDETLYGAVCRAQRADYCALIRGPFGSLVSASPELFFRWTGDELEMKPMKGTRPRGRWAEEDDSLARELFDSPKERAENLMIVDLLRNDVGRVAEFGTVSVRDLFSVERYPTVHQLTSTVTARTRPGATLTDILRAVFPSGSVTGAPKVRTMQIIRRLEDHPRGVYTGAIGFVSPDETVFNVPIRTLLVTAGGRRVEMGVGSGITYDSRPEDELAECLQKAAFVHERVREMSLLETIRHEDGTGFHLLDGHLRRLARSAAYFGYPLDPERVMSELGAVNASKSPLRVRLLVDATGEPRLECHPLMPLPAVLRARLADDPVDSRDPYLYHKTTAREVYESRLAAHPGYDELLLMNERGELTEFTTGNLMLVLDGEAFTPPVSAGLLPGVEREAMLAAGELMERTLTTADLERAEAVYLINSVRNRIPVQVER